MLQIKRSKDSRILKCIIHRLADIPGGVTIQTSELGGDTLLEGTPISAGNDGIYHVTKTVLVVTDAAADAKQYEIAKGSQLKTNDYIGSADIAGKKVTNIDKTDPSKDVITLNATLAVAVAAGTVLSEVKAADSKELKYSPVAVAGSSYSIYPNDNLFVDAWVFGMVKEGMAPSVGNEVKQALKGIIYIK